MYKNRAFARNRNRELLYSRSYFYQLRLCGAQKQTMVLNRNTITNFRLISPEAHLKGVRDPFLVPLRIKFLYQIYFKSKAGGVYNLKPDVCRIQYATWAFYVTLIKFNTRLLLLNMFILLFKSFLLAYSSRPTSHLYFLWFTNIKSHVYVYVT